MGRGRAPGARGCLARCQPAPAVPCAESPACPLAPPHSARLCVPGKPQEGRSPGAAPSDSRVGRLRPLLLQTLGSRSGLALGRASTGRFFLYLRVTFGLMLVICASILLDCYFALFLLHFSRILKLLAWILLLSSRLYKHCAGALPRAHTRVFRTDPALVTLPLCLPRSALLANQFARGLGPLFFW